MSSQNNIPEVTAFKSDFFEDELCIGVYENELSGSTKLVKNWPGVGRAIVTTPSFTDKQSRILPKNIHKGVPKYLLPLSSLDMEPVTKEELTVSEDNSERIFEILKLFSPEDVVKAISLYTDYERERSID